MNIKNKIYILTLVSSMWSMLVMAQTSFTSQTDGDWNDGATWGNTSPGVKGVDYPGPLDVVVVSPGHFIQVTDDDSCSGLTISADDSYNSYFQITNTGSLDVTNNVSISDVADFGTLFMVIDGQMNVGGIISATINNNGFVFSLSIGSTGILNINAPSAQSVFICSNSGVVIFQNNGEIHVENTISYRIPNGSDFGQHTVTNNGKFEVGNALNLINLGSSTGTITFGNTDTLIANTITIQANSPSVPSNVVLNVTDPGSTVLLRGNISTLNPGTISSSAVNPSNFVFNGSALQTIPTSVATYTFPNLVIDNPVGVNLNANLTTTNFLGDMVIADGGILNSNGRKIYASNDWIEEGTGQFNATNAGDTLFFVGTDLQTLYGDITFNRTVSINNTSLAGAVLDPSSNVTFTRLFLQDNAVFKSNGANFSVLGNVTANTGSTYVPNDNDTVFFSGTSAQTITGEIAFEDAVIQNANGVYIGSDANISFEDLTIESSGVLHANNFNFSLTGNWVNNHGTSGFEPSTGYVVYFTGFAAQSIEGSASTRFENIIINNSFSSPPQVTVNTATEILGVVDVELGQLNANGNVTLVSSATTTAVLGDFSTGTPENPAIVGNMTFQRYLFEDDSAHWYMVASPVPTSTLADWADDTYTTGFPGTDDPGYGFVSFTTWDETACGYTTPTDISDAHNHGVSQSGWFIWAETTTMLDVTGTPHVGNATFSNLSLGVGCLEGDGWHLLGNPYAAHVRWQDVALTNVTGNAAYVLQNNNSGNYVVYDQTSATDYIASGESFWVQVSNATNSIAFQENDKTGSAQDDSYNSVKLAQVNNAYFEIDMQVNSTGNNDYVKVALREQGTNSFSAEKDVLKLGNHYNKHSLAMVIDSHDVWHKYLAEDANVTIPLKIYRRYYPENTQDTINLTFHEVEMFKTYNKCLVLEDTVTQTLVPITFNGQTYTTVLPDDGVERLFLHISSPIAISEKSPSCFDIANGYISASGSGSGPFNYFWLNETGDTIKQTLNVFGSDSLKNIPEGTYQVIVSNNENCGTAYANIVLQAPLSPSESALMSESTNCVGSNTGKAWIQTSGGNAGKVFQWSNGSSDTLIANVSAGLYTVTVTDSLFCNFSLSVEVLDAPSNIQSVSVVNPSCYGQQNGSAVLNALSDNAPYTYNWSNGSTFKSTGNVLSGMYYVTVTDKNGCIEIREIEIVEPLDITSQEIIQTVSCFGEQDGSIQIQLNGGTPPYTIYWFNGDTTSTHIDTLAAGNYELLVEDARQCSKTFTFQVTEPGPVEALFTTSDDTLEVFENLVFTNASVNATDFEWNFGDGNTSIVSDPVHTYNATGNYTITLISSIQGGCTDTFSYDVTVNSLAVNTVNKEISGGIKVYRKYQEIWIETNFKEEQFIEVSLLNTLGQEIISPVQKNISTGNIRLSVPFAEGMYIVSIRNNTEWMFEKVIK